MSEHAPQPGNPPDPLAVALAQLDPAPHGFDRDALMFAAGQASKWWVLMMWRALAVAAFLTAGVFAWLYFDRPTKIEYVERQVIVDPTR